MPVTARLSKLFYDRLGEAVTNELVDWFNQVDAAYKFDLKEINELNFARFDAKLDQLRTELRADLARLESRMGIELAKVEVRLGAVDARIDVAAAQLRETVEKALRDQIKFFFLAWATLLVAIVALRFR
jgi:hypothetical protein